MSGSGSRRHPLSGIAVAGVAATRQAKSLQGNSVQICLEAAHAALEDAGMGLDDVDGISARWPGPGGTVFHPGSVDWTALFGKGFDWVGDTYPQGAPGLLDAAGAILAGQATTVLVFGGRAGESGAAVSSGGDAASHRCFVGRRRRRSPLFRRAATPAVTAVSSGGDATDAVAGYTRPDNEFHRVLGVAHRRAVRPGGAGVPAPVSPPTPSGLGWCRPPSATPGSANPAAVMYGRGPYRPADVHGVRRRWPSRSGCWTWCLATEGAAPGQHEPRARPRLPVSTGGDPGRRLGGGTPAVRWTRRATTTWPGIGSRAYRRSFGMAGLRPADVDVFEALRHQQLQVIRQFEDAGVLLARARVWTTWPRPASGSEAVIPPTPTGAHGRTRTWVGAARR